MAQIGPDGELLSNNEFLLPDGTVLKYVHKPSQCDGPHCVIHNPSDHAMRTFPLNWREDTRVMERICPHGVGHPDPDHLAWDSRTWADVHGCDGCCKGTPSAEVPTRRRVVIDMRVELEIPVDMVILYGSNLQSPGGPLLLPVIGMLNEETDKIIATEDALSVQHKISVIEYLHTETAEVEW